MKVRRTIGPTTSWRLIRITCALVLLVSIVAPVPFFVTVAAAFSEIWRSTSQSMVQQYRLQEGLAQTPPPQHTYAQRIKLFAQEVREVLFGESITAAIVIDPAVATAEVKGDRSVLVTGLMTGTTILIISGKNGRATYAIDVERAPNVKRREEVDQQADQHEAVSGFNSLYFIPGLNGGPSYLRHDFEYRQKLGNNRTLRISSEVFHFFGGGDRGRSLGLAGSFGVNRLKLGLDSATVKLDFLDSELDSSRLSFTGYTMRGLHFVSTADSRWRGLEFFAGTARPQQTFFNQGSGHLAGVIMPVWQTESLRVRAGILFIAPSKTLSGTINRVLNQPGGLILQADARYSPDRRTRAEGEVAYANGGLSGRGRIDLQRGQFTLYAEGSHLDRRSPLTSIGAQGAAQSLAAINLQWQPDTRFNTSFGYNRTTRAPLASSGRLQLNSRSSFFSANFSPTASARLGISLTQQSIDSPADTPNPLLLNLQTRSAIIRYDQRLNPRWSNSLETRLIFSSEAITASQMNRGLAAREELRYAFRRGSITGFVNYQSNTPSLESLVLRNPALLPDEFRAAFAADPQGFLAANRGSLRLLLKGVELPLTRNDETGVRFQTSRSRLDVSGQIVYSVGKFMTSQQRTLETDMSAALSLDAANSLQVSGSRALALSGGGGGRTSLTLSYIHRFGAGSGGGFQFSKLFGFGRGHIQGRVFMDLNGNGQEDPGEKGLAGMKIQIDGRQSVITGPGGDFDFGSQNAGDFDIALVSDELGVTVRASRATLQHVSLAPHQTINLRFGLTNSSFVAGRVFNDLLLTGLRSAGEAPGLAGVRLMLYSKDKAPGGQPLIQFAGGNGGYEFRNLMPGKYILEIDPATLPENYRLPLQMSWPITVSPLQGLYLDLPFVAQRAVLGFVYSDQDGDGKFDPHKDRPVEGARVVAGKSEAVSNRQGAYLLRNLPAGRVEIRVYSPAGKEGELIRLELKPEPSLRAGINLKIKG